MTYNDPHYSSEDMHNLWRGSGYKMSICSRILQYAPEMFLPLDYVADRDYDTRPDDPCFGGWKGYVTYSKMICRFFESDVMSVLNFFKYEGPYVGSGFNKPVNSIAHDYFIELVKRGDLLRRDGVNHIVTVEHDDERYEMVKLEIQRDGVVDKNQLRRLLCGMRRKEAFYGDQTIPHCPDDDEIRSLNSMNRRNPIEEERLTQKSYTAFTLISGTKESFDWPKRTGDGGNLMERVDYDISVSSYSRDATRYSQAEFDGIQFFVYGHYTVPESLGTCFNDCQSAWDLHEMRSPCIHVHRGQNDLDEAMAIHNHGLWMGPEQVGQLTLPGDVYEFCSSPHFNANGGYAVMLQPLCVINDFLHHHYHQDLHLHTNLQEVHQR